MWDESMSITQWNRHLSPPKISSWLCLHFQSFLTYSSQKKKKKEKEKEKKGLNLPNWGPKQKYGTSLKKQKGKKQKYGTGVVLSRAYL